MNKKVLSIILLILIALVVLIYSAVAETAKAVTTVDQLVEEGQAVKNVRLGARVSDEDISYQTDPEFRLSFKVKDVETKGAEIEVVYLGIMPDTLKNGRDVILEGDFDGNSFLANSLLTQCPSKYEVPTPGA